jgi:DNA invertase Pin-like site-specific DNA recombinase
MSYGKRLCPLRSCCNFNLAIKLKQMKVKYNRVSTINQHGHRNELDKEHYDLILFDVVSGKVKMEDRPEGKKLIALVRAGKVKTLVVEELSRLGRNAFDTLTTLNLCKEWGVNLVVRSLGISSQVKGEPNKLFELIGTVYSWVAEQEREAIIERTTQGRLMARAKGVRFGRPIGTNETVRDFLFKPKNKKITELLELNRPIREVARATESSTRTVQKVKHLLGRFNND